MRADPTSSGNYPIRADPTSSGNYPIRANPNHGTIIGSVSDNSDIFSVSSGSSSKICFANPMPSEMPSSGSSSSTTHPLSERNIALFNQTSTESSQSSSQPPSESQQTNSDYLPSQTESESSFFSAPCQMTQSSLLTQADDSAMDYLQQTQDWIEQDMDYINMDHNSVLVAESDYIPESVMDSEATLSTGEAEIAKELQREMKDLYDIDLCNEGENELNVQQDQNDKQKQDERSVSIKIEEDSSENLPFDQEEKDDFVHTMVVEDSDDDESIESSSQEGSDSGSPFDVDPNTGLPIFDYNVPIGISKASSGRVEGGSMEKAARLETVHEEAEINANQDEVNEGDGVSIAESNYGEDVYVARSPALFLHASQVSDCPPTFTGTGRRFRSPIARFGVFFMTLFLSLL